MNAECFFFGIIKSIFLAFFFIKTQQIINHFIKKANKIFLVSLDEVPNPRTNKYVFHGSYYRVGFYKIVHAQKR